jgi:hypothetical protein
MKYTESLTREELTAFVRFYLYRSKPFIVSLIYLVLTIVLGVAIIVSDVRVLIVLFVAFMSLIMITWVWANLAQFRALKIYAQSQYPQEFDFAGAAITATCASGISYVVPWKHIRKIYAGRLYVYFATAVGPFWVHTERFAEHLPAVTALWKQHHPNKPR